MLLIDGSQGEGGGQILRTALGLSLVTGTPIRIEKIRAGRAKPGLLRQHLTAVNAATAIGAVDVEGATLGSQELTFRPGTVKPGEYRFAVGTAGSTGLVLQTVLPPLLTAPGPSTLTLEGGTHNPTAPPFDFLARAFLPLISRMGPSATARLERPGFYPAGGGQMHRVDHPGRNPETVHAARARRHPSPHGAGDGGAPVAADRRARARDRARAPGLGRRGASSERGQSRRRTRARQ